MMRATWALALVMACSGSRAPSGTSALDAGAKAVTGPQRLRLDNGLDVTLLPMAGADAVALLVLFDVGEAHDPPGRSGLAHLIEHVYVTAAAGDTAARDAAGFAAAYPLGWNAQTGERYTAVAQVFPRGQLEAELVDAAARMSALQVTDVDLGRERPRLAEELANMFDRVPELAAANWARDGLRAAESPLRRRGGVLAQMATVTADEVTAHWRRFYRPPNVHLVLVGGFEVAAAETMVHKAFGSVTRGDALPALATAAAPVPRVARLESTSAMLACLAFPAALPGDADYAAFVVIAARLLAASTALATDQTLWPVQYPPLDDPGSLLVCTRAAAGEDDVTLVARLDAFVAEQVAAVTPADAAAARQMFGWLLAPPPATAGADRLYAIAFQLGRSAQLGLDGAAVLKTFDTLDAAALQVAAARFGADRQAVAIFGVTPRGGKRPK